MTTLAGATIRAGVDVVLGMAAVAILGQLDCVFDRVLVARIAMDFFVRAVELKFRVFVVIEDPHLPIGAVVAAAAMWSLLTFMHIVAGMTCRTLHFCVLKRRRGVTFFTGNGGMRTEQRKLRQIVIEVDLLDPAIRRVALVTRLSFLPFVRIVLTMTRVTVFGRFVLVHIARMAIDAFYLLVLAFEWILGFFVVVKFDLRPALRRVTGVTFLPVAPFVIILEFMTRVTIRFEVFFVDVIALVALSARHLLVFGL